MSRKLVGPALKSVVTEMADILYIEDEWPWIISFRGITPVYHGYIHQYLEAHPRCPSQYEAYNIIDIIDRDCHEFVKSTKREGDTIDKPYIHMMLSIIIETLEDHAPWLFE